MSNIDQVGGIVQVSHVQRNETASGTPTLGQQSGISPRHATGNSKARATTSAPVTRYATLAYSNNQGRML
jgi:hypothetical protein